jgi:hypothetical protein
MEWRILVNFIRQSMLRLPTHSGFRDLFLKQELAKGDDKHELLYPNVN